MDSDCRSLQGAVVCNHVIAIHMPWYISQDFTRDGGEVELGIQFTVVMHQLERIVRTFQQLKIGIGSLNAQLTMFTL